MAPASRTRPVPVEMRVIMGRDPSWQRNHAQSGLGRGHQLSWLALWHHGCVLDLMHHAFVLARIRLTRTAAERGPVLSGACGQMGVFHKPWLSKCLPCASPRSEHGILGKRRVKLRSPAVGRTPRGCQPDEQFRPRLSGTLWSAAVRVRGSRAQRRGRWNDCIHFSRKIGTGVNGTYL